MQDKINGWDIEEIKKLINTINSLGQGKISQAFLLHSKKFNRKSTSVRNFYYNLIKLKKENPNKFKNIFPIFYSFDTRRFDEKSQEELLLNLLDNSDNLSVRKKCLKLANFDKTKMLRIQNKYYNLLKNNPNLVKKCVFLLKKAKKPVRDIGKTQNPTMPKNIISMPVNSTKILSDADINSLFLGLVNLVKENTKQTLKNSIQKEVNFMTSALQKSLIELRKKDTLIRNLETENDIISKKLSTAENKLNEEVVKNQNNLNTIKELANSEKMQKLRDFLQKINNFVAITSKQPIDK